MEGKEGMETESKGREGNSSEKKAGGVDERKSGLKEKGRNKIKDDVGKREKAS